MAVGVMRRTVIGQGDTGEEESPKLEGRKEEGTGREDETMDVLENYEELEKRGRK